MRSSPAWNTSWAELPLVTDVKHNSLDDGPGIRSVVFFKGCPLRCRWCQNPETQSPWPELQFSPAACIGCHECLQVCPGGGAARLLEQPGDHSRCRRCGRCIAACPAGARRRVGRRLELDELLARLSADEPFYRASGGGVTLSGGEPTMFPRFSGELAARLAERGISVLLETCGWFDRSACQRLLQAVATIYFDLKLADEQEHRRHTGKGNRRILDNLAWLVREWPGELLVRVPLVPGITTGAGNLERLAELARGLGIERLALLPYNPLWLDKAAGLARAGDYHHRQFMSEEDIAACHQIVAAAGLQVV